ncbi:unnamed protein product [Trichogramma brassicae]|uniref:Uncharacterized protein n=1 Tax=Trichogramma brassicae TaxID=86971 RepID=A0A6H5I2Z0_9HYME|nr:unnamed protein product [Trichogramma brassicae]
MPVGMASFQNEIQTQQHRTQTRVIVVTKTHKYPCATTLRQRIQDTSLELTMTDLHRVILKCLLCQLERFDDSYSEHRALVQSALADLTKFQELEFPEVVVLGSDCHKEDWDLDTDCTFCGLPRCNPPPPIYRPVDDLGRVLCAFIDLLISPSAHAQTRAVIEDTLEKSVNP